MSTTRTQRTTRTKRTTALLALTAAAGLALTACAGGEPVAAPAGATGKGARRARSRRRTW